MEILTEEEVIARWDEVLDRVESGEIIIITRDGKPVVRMVKYEHAIASERAKESA
jgi:prevent-host-death family protein